MTAKKKKPESGSKRHRLRFWLNKEMPDDGTRKDGSSNWPAKLLKKFKKPQKKAVTLPEQHTAPNLSREASTQRDSTLTEAKNRGSAVRTDQGRAPEKSFCCDHQGERFSSSRTFKEGPSAAETSANGQGSNVTGEAKAKAKEKFDLPTKSKHEKEKAKDSKDRTSKEKPLEKRDSLRERVKNSVRKFDESLRKRKKRPEKPDSDKESNKNTDVDPSKASLKNRHLSKEFKKRKKKASEVEGKEVKEGKSKRNRKVSKRKEFREKQSTSAENSKAASSSSLLKQGDEMFPTVKRKAPPPKSPSAPSKQAPIKSVPEGNALHNNIKEKLFKEKPHTVEEKTIEKTKEDSNPNDAKDLKDTKKGCKEECEKKRLKLVKNNDNNGMLFLEDGRPFWQQKGKGIRGRQDVDPEDDLTDDELPMNAEVLLEVHLGKIKLVEMPTQQVTLDPYATLEVLESRDELFFVRNMLFSNTVRSMINLNDDATLSEKKSSQEKAKLTWKEEPTQIGVYDQRKPRNIAAEKRK
ncbi:hypothetical protein L596_013700 [Steinernema carpocapsae]|uniref:Uncharacterized protein n=1 Tax=Steinernema carpocapsae TaxID=34508 RepID=A0A4U5P0Y3_STECR|nr:hypothetical protein L596_013700 [Steinernema carpocapsae]